MAKYHINPKTGNPGLCKAKYKCRFGDMESEHYSSKEEARNAYEKQQKLNSFNSVFKIKKDSSYSLPKDRINVFNFDENKSIYENRENFVKYLKDSGVNSFKVGKITKADGEELKRLEVYQNIADDLLKKFTVVEDNNGVEEVKFINPPTFTMGYGDSSKYAIGGGFIPIGSGVTNNAYLHESTGMVFKVPNGWSKERGFDDGEGNIKDNLVIKDKYEKLSGEKLSEEYNIDYAKTYFLNSSLSGGVNVPIQVQEYLSPEEYGEVFLTDEMENELSRKYGETFGDFHEGNIMRHKKSGRIVLIDCIMAWEDDEDAPW